MENTWYGKHLVGKTPRKESTWLGKQQVEETPGGEHTWQEKHLLMKIKQKDRQLTKRRTTNEKTDNKKTLLRPLAMLAVKKMLDMC